MKKQNGIYYYPTYQLARFKRDQLVAVQDADESAKINSFSLGYAVQEKRGGKYWGEVTDISPCDGKPYQGEGWV